jgi:hypothetical protein
MPKQSFDRKPTTSLPDFPTVSRLLGDVSPLKRPKALERALNKAFPKQCWLVKNTDSYWYSCVVAVIAPDGSLVAADTAAWIKEQLPLVGGERLIQRIKNENLRFVRPGGETAFYALGFDPNEPLEFIQIHFWPESRIVYAFPDINLQHLEMQPDNWDNYWTLAEQPAPTYKCRPDDIINSLGWLKHCKISHLASRKRDFAKMKSHFVNHIYMDGSKSTKTPMLESFSITEEWCQEPSNAERWFADWKASSARIYPMGRFWYLKTFDYTDREGMREAGFIPQAVIWPRRMVEEKQKSAWRLMDELDRFDKAIRHPFAWYFYMLHGRLISRRVGEVVADAIRRGEIHFNARDETVLMAWADNKYGF